MVKELERRKASKSLIAFAGYTNDLYTPASHHWLMAKALEKVEQGEIDRLMIFMPPRHGKSELASRRFPAYYLGKNPARQIIGTSYGAELAQDFGREVRNCMASTEFWDIFPDVRLRHDSKAAQRWNTNKGGQYIAAGVCGPVTGRGAHVLLIDDPVKDREEADSEIRRDKVWNWYTSTAYPRLMPGGAVVLIQCMVGDTPVLMADGTEMPLKHINPGDKIATYDNGRLTVSTVKNWHNQGPDYVFTIRTKSGLMVKANERHPFLVCRNGEPEWVKLKNLRVGDSIIKASQSPSEPLSTYEIISDCIVEITESGYEDVFDIQVDRTENFIANGLVSHNTRWHEDDLAGRLLEAQKSGGDQWHVVNLPAISTDKESGEERALWPDWYPLDALKRMQNVIGRRDWTSLYQQNPVPDDGSYFKRDDLRYYETQPEHLSIYGASDYAVTDDGGDYTEHGIIGVDPDDNIYILDWWFGKTQTDVWIEELFRLADDWKPIEWGEEAGQIEKSVGPFIQKRQREAKNYFFRKQWASSKDKPTRAQAIRGRVQQGKVYFPVRPTHWKDHVISQMMAFPAGKNDDSVDVLSLFGRMLARMQPGRVPAGDKPVVYQKDLKAMTFNEIMERLKRKRLADD